MLRLKLSFVSFSLLFTIVFTTSCDFNPNYTGMYLVDRLEDSIPYDILRKGRLVFYRSVFNPGEQYNTVYVIDIINKKSWHSEDMHDPSVSPDGQHIAYISTVYNGSTVNRNVCRSDIRGRDRRQYTSMNGAYCPCWTPDGTSILFLEKDVKSGETHHVLYQLFISYDSVSTTPVVDFSEINAPETYTPSEPVSLSTKGLYVMSSNGIYTFESAGKNFKKIIPLQSDLHSIQSPAWSPDGNKLAVISFLRNSSTDKNIGTYSVIQYDPDGNHPDTIISLSNTKISVFDPNHLICWSPDGKQIAFVKPPYYSTGDSELYVINSDHTGLTLITQKSTSRSESLSWSR